jgi:general secretion pathway protein J
MTRRAAGFTLLEMIVALVVLGLVVLGAAQGVRFGIAAWTGQSRHIGQTAELDGIDRVLRNLFHGIAPVAGQEIAGGTDSFSFVGHLPDVVPGQLRLADMILTVTKDRRFVLRWRPHRHADNLTSLPFTETELLSDVETVQFSYQIGQGGGWLTAVSGNVPSLIRVHIEGRKGDRRHWPDILAAPLVSPG